MRDESSEQDPASSRPADHGRMILLGHDLRAAVSDIIGGLRLVDQSALDSAMRLQLERVRASGEIVARLLEEGLSMMLGEDDFAATHPANLQMSRFLYDIEMRWSGRASEMGLRFQMTRGPDVPEVLTLDRVALERVISNILSNAFKYTDTGTVDLGVSMSRTGALQIAVTDQGPGFSPEALARLFEYEGRPDGNAKPGQGLGMHISKHMTGRLGGSISVENLPRQGSRVILELPPDTWTIAAPYHGVELPDLRDTRVLVAEDSPTNQTIISHLLAKMGARFEFANDGVEALQWLERENFDLALIDIEMPNLTGLDVIRAVRASKHRHSEMPVIAITAYVLRANRDAIYAAGADAILAKPFAGLETFGLSIANALNGHRDMAADAVLVRETDLDFDRACFDRLLDVAGPDAANELLDRLSADLRSCERNLVAALAEDNRKALRAETHILIALAAAVGATRLQALAQSLNSTAHRNDVSTPGNEALAHLDRLIHFVEQERTRRGDAE